MTYFLGAFLRVIKVVFVNDALGLSPQQLAIITVTCCYWPAVQQQCVFSCSCCSTPCCKARSAHGLCLQKDVLKDCQMALFAGIIVFF